MGDGDDDVVVSVQKGLTRNPYAVDYAATMLNAMPAEKVGGIGDIFERQQILGMSVLLHCFMSAFPIVLFLKVKCNDKEHRTMREERGSHFTTDRLIRTSLHHQIAD